MKAVAEKLRKHSTKERTVKGLMPVSFGERIPVSSSGHMVIQFQPTLPLQGRVSALRRAVNLDPRLCQNLNMLTLSRASCTTSIMHEDVVSERTASAL